MSEELQHVKKIVKAELEPNGTLVNDKSYEL